MPPKLAAVPNEPTPVIGYIRVSMAREEMISPEIQKTSLVSWAARTNRRIIDWVYDLDKSGRNFRRKVMRLIERIENAEAREIGVYRYDRWGRNSVESLANVKRVELAGGRVESATEPFDVETAVGKYSRTNAFAIAEMQSDLISENWKAALANRVERGLPPSGSARFGYVRLGRVPDPHARIGGRYRSDPDDDQGERYEPDYATGLADIHVDMYDRYIVGESFLAIAEWLNSRAIKNTRGGVWSDVTVKNVLDSGFAAGLLRKHDPECRCGKPSSCSRRVYVPGSHEALLDETTWQQYLTTRAERAKMPPRARYPTYPLTGLVYCGHCHYPMKIQSGGAPARPGYGYRCSRWHHYRDCDAPFPRRSVLEERVREQLAVWAADVDTSAETAAVRAARKDTAAADRARLQAALDELDAALQRLAVKAAVDDKMPPAVYEKARDELLDRRAPIEVELVKAHEAHEAADLDYAPIAAGLLAEWEVLAPQRRRDILGDLVRHITATREDRPKLEGMRHKPRALIHVDITPVWEPCECPICERAAAAEAI